ncbi:hypothetical protein ES703_49680 [subsurface metagenome]
MLPKPDPELIQYFKKGFLNDDGNYIDAWEELKKVGEALRRFFFL